LPPANIISIFNNVTLSAVCDDDLLISGKSASGIHVQKSRFHYYNFCLPM